MNGFGFDENSNKANITEELYAQVAELNSTIGTMNSTIATMQSSISSLESRVATLEARPYIVRSNVGTTSFYTFRHTNQSNTSNSILIYLNTYVIWSNRLFLISYRTSDLADDGKYISVPYYLASGVRAQFTSTDRVVALAQSRETDSSIGLGGTANFIHTNLAPSVYSFDLMNDVGSRPCQMLFMGVLTESSYNNILSSL